jgi:DNA-binding NarL/FixJ family response regulator
MPTRITLLVAYPKELIRAGLRAMLEKTGIKIVGEADNAPSTQALVKKHKPDVVILDAAIPAGDAFELAAKLSKFLPASKFVFLTAIDNPTYMARARAVGATNCLLESVSQKEFVTAIENAAAGKPAAGSGPFIKIAASLDAREVRAGRKTNLTPREAQVLSHIAFGLSNDEISRSLEVSVETVKEHVQNVLRKLEAADRTQAAVWAVKAGLV